MFLTVHSSNVLFEAVDQPSAGAAGADYLAPVESCVVVSTASHSSARLPVSSATSSLDSLVMCSIVAAERALPPAPAALAEPGAPQSTVDTKMRVHTGNSFRSFVRASGRGEAACAGERNYLSSLLERNHSTACVPSQ